MAKRPQRPAQHVLEDASRRAFETALPEGWVCRWPSHDYGIDGEVEIFDEGSAIGHLFKVQLKGTRERNTRRALTVRFRHEQANYYYSLHLPVLVALFHEPGNQVYVRWFQSFDPHHDKISESAWAMRFTADHAWNDTTAERLWGDVTNYHRLREAHALPIKLRIQMDGASVAGASSAQVAIALRSAASTVQDILQFVSVDGADVAGTVHLDEGRASVDFRSLASSTVHYPVPWPGAPSADTVVADVLTSIGVVLERFGHGEAAARCFQTWGRNSSLMNDVHAAIGIMTTIGFNHRIPEAMAIADEIAARHPDDTLLVRSALLMVLSRVKSQLTKADGEFVQGAFLRQIQSAVDSGDTLEAGRANYNAANWLQSTGHYSEAIPHYRSAVELDPGYNRRDYFHAELGGSLFETHEFVSAADEYKKAMDLGDPQRYQPLFADSLMMSGSYAEAQLQFRDYLARTESDVHEWHLKARVLGDILRVAGGSQVRDESSAMAIADVSEPSMTESERETRLLEALEIDGLCSIAWFNLGLLSLGREALDAARTAFLIAAVIDRYDTTSWCWAAILAVMTGAQGALLPQIVGCASALTRERFSTELVRLSGELEPSKTRDLVLGAIDGILAELPRPQPQDIEIRAHGRDGVYETMRIAGSK